MSKTSFLGIRELVRDRQRLTVFLSFLGFSVLIWGLISLGHSYNTTILVPVKYVNAPENKVLQKDVPMRIAINVAGSGYDIIKHGSRLDRDTLAIDMSKLNRTMVGEFERGYLDANEIAKALQERAGGDLSVNRVISDSIEFIFDLKVLRTIPVKPKLNYSVAPGYVALDSGRSNPQDLDVYGALSILDTMTGLPTLMTELGELDQSTTRKVAIDHSVVGRAGKLSDDSVMIHVEIDQLTEKRVIIEPEMINVPDSLSMIIFPKSVEVSFQVPLSRFAQVTDEDFLIQIDYLKAPGGLQILPVDLTSWPGDARNVRVLPGEVEFVIRREP